MIDDLSYSGLTGKIQGDLNEGRSIIIELSHRYVSQKERVAKLEKELADAKNDMDSLHGGVQKVMQHLKLKYPLAVKVKSGIIVISERQLTIETNVL